MQQAASLSRNDYRHGPLPPTERDINSQAKWKSGGGVYLLLLAVFCSTHQVLILNKKMLAVFLVAAAFSKVDVIRVEF
jgi:hypothetical protein